MAYYPERKPAAPGREEEAARQAKKGQKRLRLSLILLSCLLIGYGGVRLLLYHSELVSSRETSAELKQIYDQETDKQSDEDTAPPSLESTEAPSQVVPSQEAPSQETPSQETPSQETPPQQENTGTLLPVSYPGNPRLMISDKFLKLRRKSEYIVGWLSLDGVDEAVAQKDNTFFLKHDASGKRNGNGAIFLDEGISLRTRPYTLILYGHNMKSGNMFGRLKRYKENTYFHQNRIIRFDTLYEEGEYAVFSVMEMDTTPGIARWYDLWSLETDSRADREEAIRKLERRSAVSSALDVQADDQILLLVTCLDGDTERLVVAARRLREGETADNLTIHPAK